MTKKILLSLFLSGTITFSINATETATIYSENFDALTAGSHDSPDEVEISADKTIDTSLTNGYQWKGRGLHQAGGALAILHFEQSDWMGTELVQGYVQTPYTDVRLDGGLFIVRFKAKALSDAGASIHIELYDPYTTNSIDTSNLNITSDWGVYEAELRHPGYGNHLAYMQIASDENDWLMDDFEIIQNYSELMPPITHFAKNVSYEQFTANWNPVPLATSYLVSAFSLDSDNTRKYIIEDAVSTDCELPVSGTTKGQTYYYTVKSVNDKYTSEESEPYQVYVPLNDLDKPQTLPATEISSNGFTANWEPVFRAMGYLVDLKRVHQAEKDENFTILHEDFEKCEGYADYPDYATPFYYNLDDYTTMPGWTAPATAVCASGKFGIDNYWKKYEGPGVLISPALDFSGTERTFNVTLNVVGTKGDNVSVECDGVIKTHTLADTHDSFVLTFSNGKSGSKIKFYFDGDATLLFDDIIIAQEIHAGDTVIENLGSFNTSEAETAIVSDNTPNQYIFTNLAASKNDEFIYSVKAWSWSLGEDGVWGPTVYSQESEPRRVSLSVNTGITEAESQSATISVHGHTITVSGVNTDCAEVYTVAGTLLRRLDTPLGTASFEAPNSGVYIIRTGSSSHKIIVR